MWDYLADRYVGGWVKLVGMTLHPLDMRDYSSRREELARLQGFEAGDEEVAFCSSFGVFLQDGVQYFTPPANEPTVSKNMFLIVLGRVRK